MKEYKFQIARQQKLIKRLMGGFMNIVECAKFISKSLPRGKKILDGHLLDFKEILLHVLAGDLINEALIGLLSYNKE